MAIKNYPDTNGDDTKPSGPPPPSTPPIPTLPGSSGVPLSGPASGSGRTFPPPPMAGGNPPSPSGLNPPPVPPIPLVGGALTGKRKKGKGHIGGPTSGMPPQPVSELENQDRMQSMQNTQRDNKSAKLRSSQHMKKMQKMRQDGKHNIAEMGNMGGINDLMRMAGMSSIPNMPTMPNFSCIPKISHTSGGVVTINGLPVEDLSNPGANGTTQKVFTSPDGTNITIISSKQSKNQRCRSHAWDPWLSMEDSDEDSG